MVKRKFGKSVVSVLLVLCILIGCLGLQSVRNTVAAAGEEVPILYAAYAPQIDGNRDDIWSRHVAYQVYSQVGSTPSADLRGKISVMWDAVNLYAFVEVNDGTVKAGDMIKIMLDVNNDKQNTYGADDYVYSFTRGSSLIVEEKNNKTAGVQMVQKEAAGGYIVETKLPWSTLGEKPGNGVRLGIHALIVDDGDSADHRVGWLSSDVNTENNPSLLGTVNLQEKAYVNVPSGTTGPVIMYTGTAPVLDGNLDAIWTKQTAHQIKTRFSTDKAIPQWMDEDLSGTVRLLWDEKYLYALYEIKDDILSVQTPQTPDYRDDNIELMFDINNSRGTAFDGIDDYQYRIARNSNVVLVARGPSTGNTGVECVTMEVTGGYTMEIKFPWSTWSAIPVSGYNFGIETCIQDDDDFNDTRDARYQWFSTSGDTYRNPSLYTTATLAGKDRIEDHIPPLAPENLKVTADNAVAVDISWDAAVDNEAVKQYYVYNDGALLGVTKGLFYTVRGLMAQGTYTVSVKAEDLSGNFSEAGSIIVTTPPSEDIAPVIDCFEGFDDSSTLLNSRYKTHEHVTLTLDPVNKKSGNYALKAVTHPTITGTGIYKSGVWDYLGYNGMQVWVKSDAIGYKLNFMFNEESGEQWQMDYWITRPEELVTLNFGDFRHPTGNPGGDGIMDLHMFRRFQIYLCDINGAVKTFYFDDITLIYNPDFAGVPPMPAPVPIAPAPFGTRIWDGKDGVVVIEAENMQNYNESTSSWKVYTTVPGYTGTSALRATKGNTYNAAFTRNYTQITDPTAKLTYFFMVDSDGDYIINVRNRHELLDGDNDVWISVNESQWKKQYDHTEGEYSYDESDYSYNLARGLNKVEFAPRSNNFCLDRIVVHKRGVPENAWMEASIAESTTSSGGLYINETSGATNRPNFTISGYVAENAYITVTNNEKTVLTSVYEAIPANNTNYMGFYAHMVLDPGINSIKVMAETPTGRTSTVGITLDYDFTSPVILLDKVPPLTTNVTNYTLSGCLKREGGYVTIKHNGTNFLGPVYKEYNESFSQLINLVDGPNTIQIIATDKLGNADVVDYSITFTREYAGTFTIGNVKLTDFAGNAIEKLITSGSARVSADVINNSASAKSAVLVIALYNKDNALKSHSFVEMTVNPGGTVKLKSGLALPANIEGYKIKVLVWDSIEGMKPLSNIVTLQ